MMILEGLWMKNFAVDQGLFNRKENDKRVNKRMERKMTNQHVSELNVSINVLKNGNYGKCEWKSFDACKENGDDDV